MRHLRLTLKTMALAAAGLAVTLIARAVDAPAATAATAATAAAAAPMGPDNPFAQPSRLPYQLPPFDRIRDRDYRPAFMAGMAAQRAEVAAIAHAPQPPSFDNTIVALERSGRLLDRVSSTFFNLTTSNSDEEILRLETEMAPQLAAHQDAIHLDAALFARIEALYDRRSQLHLDAQSLRLLERYHTDFVRAGARLGAGRQQRLRSINQQVSALMTRFGQNVLRATRDGAVVVGQASQLEGLSASQIAAAADAARERGLGGKWLIALQNTTTQPVLAQLTTRRLRERIYRASIARGSGGAADNTAVIVQLVKLRAERARLLGYPTHAAYVLADETAGNPQAVRTMLLQVAGAALPAAHREAGAIQQIIDAEAAASRRPSFALQPWDWQYYSEQVRKSRYDFDAAQVRPYFELDRVLQDGVFFAANRLFGLTFKERHDLPVYRSDVRVFEVFDRDGAPLALFLADYYAHDNKQGGAWMNNYVVQSKLFGLKPVVVNNLNIPKPPAGAPTLLTFDEVTAMFHEFGHALHGMLSDVEYPLLSGTNVPPDFVEYPSQYNEMWAREPAVVAHFARHYQTGEPMPQALLERVLAAQRFDQGYLTSEYIEAALIDLAWHEIGPAQAPRADQVAAFETAALRHDGVAYAPVPPRYHSPYFLHIFSDEYADYSAGYYAYLWSEVLARDTGQWLHAHGGLTRVNGDYLRARILSRGRTEEPRQLFQDFYGAPPDIEPLLDYRGLAPPK